MKKFLPYIAILAAMLIWAGSGIAIKSALSVIPPITLIVTRFTLSVVLMLVLGLLFRSSSLLGLQPLARRDWGLFALAGFFQPFLYYIVETYCYQSLNSPTIAEALLSTGPLLAPLLAFVFLRERVTRNNILGILISTAGVLMLVLFGSSNFSIGNPWGILLAFLAVLTAVLYCIILKRIPEHYSALSIIFYVQLFSLLLFYPLWGLTEAPDLPEHFADISGADVLQAVYAVLYLVALSSLVAYILFCYTVRVLGVTLTNAFNNIRPVFTALIMLLLYDEHMPLGKWMGIIIIIAGLFVCQYHKKYES